MDFVLFILVTAILFLRPSDFVPGLEVVPLYLIAIVPCLLLSWNKLVPQLSMKGLRELPVLVFGIGILLVSIISSSVNERFQLGVDFASGFIKLLILFMLMLAQLDSARRLKFFLGCLVGIILIPIVLAVLNFHGYIGISAFETMDSEGVRRIGATGNFGDPNDVCEILNVAMIFSLYGLLDRGRGLTRVLWLAPMALFGYALALTQSRGGFLGAAAGLAVLLLSRFQGTKSLVMAAMLLALMFVVFGGGRQTSFSTGEGTSQSRIQLWDDGFEMFKQSPLIGVGIDGFFDPIGHAPHNAFVKAYAELGFLGGALLFGQYFYSLRNLASLGSKRVTLPDREMSRLHPSCWRPWPVSP